MNDFIVRMSDGRKYFIRGEQMKDILDQIGNARMTMDGFLDVRIPTTYEYVTINTNQIVSIKEDDEF